MTVVYRRIADTDQEPFDDELVVMNAKTEAVVALNGPARVLWEALAEGAPAAELEALFTAACPGADSGRDVAEALAALTDAGLVVAAEG